MKRIMPLIATVPLVFFILTWSTGCQTTGRNHALRAAADNDSGVVVCQQCYDMAVRHRDAFKGGKGFGAEYKTVTKHQCAECQGEISLYVENDTPMIKCQRCAPEGIACDRCLPPNG